MDHHHLLLECWSLPPSLMIRFSVPAGLIATTGLVLLLYLSMALLSEVDSAGTGSLHLCLMSGAGAGASTDRLIHPALTSCIHTRPQMFIPCTNISAGRQCIKPEPPLSRWLEAPVCRESSVKAAVHAGGEQEEDEDHRSRPGAWGVHQRRGNGDEATSSVWPMARGQAVEQGAAHVEQAQEVRGPLQRSRPCMHSS